MTDQLKMSLASVAIEHAIITPLGRWLGQRRFAYDCMCGGVITEDRNTDPWIDRDTAYNMHLLVAAMRAITPNRCCCGVDDQTDPPTVLTCRVCPVHGQPTAEGKPA